MNYREILWATKNYNAYKIANRIKSKNHLNTTDSLKNILNYATKNVPYYAKYKSNRLLDFPILTKDIIRSNFNNLISSTYKGKTITTYSGGSTGEPVPIKHCQEHIDWTNGLLFHYYKTNFKKSWQEATTLEIWGSPSDIKNKEGKNIYKHLKNIVYSSYCYNCFIFNETDYMKCIHILNSKKPYFLKGYVNSLLELATFIEKNNIKVHSPKYILPRSSPLERKGRKYLEKVFESTTCDLYGSREVSAIAAETLPLNENKYNVFNSNCFVEVDENNDLLITTFHNYSMPIIRFKIGDKSSILSSNNDKQVLGPIKGRIYDYIKFKNGVNIHSQYFIQKFFNTSIHQFQIKQTDLDLLCIKYVDPNNSIKKSFMQSFEKDINEIANTNIRFLWQKTNQIKKNTNGKFLYVQGLHKNV